MKVYIFGNQDLESDSYALELSKKLAIDLPEINFIEIKPNADLPFENSEDVVIMDVVEGIKAPTLIKDQDINKISIPPRNSVHDFDLGFQLKYLKKLGKIGKVTLIALPMNGNIDYDSIHSIFRKLVAQDMQGS